MEEQIGFHLLDFPVELLLRQLSFLSVSDLLSVGRTCRLLKGLSRSNSLWMPICNSRWKCWDELQLHKIKSLTEDDGWRAEFDRRRKIDKETFKAIKSIVFPSLHESVCSKREIVEALIQNTGDEVVIEDCVRIMSCNYSDRSEIVDSLRLHENIGIKYWAEKIKQIVHENMLLEEWKRILNKAPSAEYEDGAILIARWVYPDLTEEEIKSQFDGLAAGLEEHLCREEGADWKNTLVDRKLIYALNRYFFEKLGFRGNSDYYSPSNSYINTVLETHLGIPITLSLVYVAVSKRVGVQIDMMNVPGHFMVRYVDPRTNHSFMIDPFNQGQIPREDANDTTRTKPAATKREVWTRMLYNLLRLSNDQPIDMMIYLVRQMVAIDPTEPNVSTLSGLLLHLEKHRMAATIAVQFFPEGHSTRQGILKKCEQVARIKSERKSRKPQQSAPTSIASTSSNSSTPSYLTASTPALSPDFDTTATANPTRLSTSMPTLPSVALPSHVPLLLGDVVTSDDPFAGIVCRKWGTDYKVLFPRALSRIVAENQLQRNVLLSIENTVTVGRYFIGMVHSNRYRPSLRLIRLHPDVVTPEDKAFAIEWDHRLSEEIRHI